jgi:hypothetical protein
VGGACCPSGAHTAGPLLVRREVVDEIVVDRHGSAAIRHVSQFAGSVADEAATVIPAHRGHAVKIPVRAWIVRENAEVVVLCIGICDIARVQDDVGADRTIYTVTKGTDPK